MITDLKLHQALHGYGDGHQLLASSIELTREQQWQMLVMTDLSGPSFRNGFDSYLTGYPLDSGGYYCFAKTWMAFELTRPGCVWTHTIVLSDTDLARIDDFGMLTALFRRPNVGAADFDRYSQELYINSAIADRRDISSSAARVLIKHLYGSPTRRIVITAESAATNEPLIVALFSQQWPRLRRSFRFCTGALAIKDITFDVAVAPPNVVKDASGDVVMARVDDDLTPPEDWLCAASEDLVQVIARSPLRRFLWTYGPDYSDGRAVFRALCELQLASSRSPDGLEEILSALAHFFPDAASGRRLKAALLGISGTFAQAPMGEAAVIEALITHPAAQCISPEVASIQHRSAALLETDSASAIRIGSIAVAVGGLHAEEYLDGVATALHSRPECISTLSSAPLMLSLLKRNPGLLAMPELWEVPANEQLRLAAQLSSVRDIGKHARLISAAVVVANAWSVIAIVLEQCGADGMNAVLEWLDATEGIVLEPPPALRAALLDQRHLYIGAIAQGSSGPKSLRIAASLLDPRSGDVRRMGAHIWEKATGREMRFADADAELRSRAFLLSLGLSAHEKAAARLVRDGFHAVYEAAKYNQLNDNLWGFVEPFLPWYWLTWDRCARLIRGVVRKFVEHDWSTAEFVDTFMTHEQLGRALAEAKSFHQGGAYVRKLRRQIKAGDIVIDGYREAALKQLW